VLVPLTGLSHCGLRGRAGHYELARVCLDRSICHVGRRSGINVVAAEGGHRSALPSLRNASRVGHAMGIAVACFGFDCRFRVRRGSSPKEPTSATA